MAGQGRMLGASIEEMLDYQAEQQTTARGAAAAGLRDQPSESTTPGDVVVDLSTTICTAHIDQFDSLGIEAVAIVVPVGLRQS